jgi:PncC family amidohydrolase
VDTSHLADLAEAVGSAAQARGWTVACAESVTAGVVAQRLAAAPEASDWFAGGVVAYRTATKRDLLGVTAERIISAECAEQLALGVARLLEADVAVGITGVGGPDDEEGRPPGTVYIAVAAEGRVEAAEHALEGDAEGIIEQAVEQALRLLAAGEAR